MRSAAHDTAEFLADGGLGALGSELFVGSEPAGPDDCITVYDTPGLEPDPDNQRYRPAVQVRVRGASYVDAYERAATAREILIGTAHNRSMGDSVYVGFWNEGDISSLGRDESNRHRLVATYRIIRQSEV